MDWEVSRKFWDEYERIGRPLGEGAFGAVYKVKDKKGRLYALKLLKRGVDDETSRDVDMLMALSEFPRCHQGVVCYYGKYLVPPPEDPKGALVPAILMEFVDGPTLAQLKRRRPSVLLQLLETALESLVYVHDNGIAHRDLKPDNIIAQQMDDRLQAVLIDFGLACNFRDSAKAVKDYPCKGRAGTPLYMAPELFSDKKRGPDFYPKTDVFGLGATFAELLGGQRPDWFVSRGDVRGVDLKVLEEWRRLLKEVSSGQRSPATKVLAAVLADMLQPSPSARPSASQALYKLRRLRRFQRA